MPEQEYHLGIHTPVSSMLLSTNNHSLILSRLAAQGSVSHNKELPQSTTVTLIDTLAILILGHHHGIVPRRWVCLHTGTNQPYQGPQEARKEPNFGFCSCSIHHFEIVHHFVTFLYLSENCLELIASTFYRYSIARIITIP